MLIGGGSWWAGRGAASAVGLVVLLFAPALARADTLEMALVQAYLNNPTLNSQRASVRVTDENVPQALSGYRPKISITGTAGQQSVSSISKTPSPLGQFPVPGQCSVPSFDANTCPALYDKQSGYGGVANYGATITQTIFNGFQTANRTRQAESQVQSARATLRVTEQTVLLNAATAYMNLLRDTAVLDLQRRNVEVLQEQLRQTRDRFNVGEVTRTDVAQSESRLAAGRSQVLTAEATYKASVATYRQVIGVNPGTLSAGTPVDRFSPHELPAAVTLAITTHPSIATAQYNVDAALEAVKVAEGALMPTVSVTGNYLENYGAVGSLNSIKSYQATVLGTVSIPVYQGGAEYSAVRQAKETLGQRRLDLDVARDQARQTTVQAWGQLEAAKANVDATQAQVQAAEIALNGVREEARVGQRTTLDVLNAQQELVNARVALVGAQRDRVVASYTLLAAVGRLAPEVLGLRVPTYQPQVHYQQVRDNWVGLRIPDGR